MFVISSLFLKSADAVATAGITESLITIVCNFIRTGSCNNQWFQRIGEKNPDKGQNSSSAIITGICAPVVIASQAQFIP
jgi:hypothetical protein